MNGVWEALLVLELAAAFAGIVLGLYYAGLRSRAWSAQARVPGDCPYCGVMSPFPHIPPCPRAKCVRCAEIRAAHWSSLLYFFNPNHEDTEEDGEAVRAIALRMHADLGHPTEEDYRR